MTSTLNRPAVPHKAVSQFGKKTLLSIAGFFVALIFLIPYLRMLVTALTPKGDVYKIPAEYFPSDLDFTNFITVWDSAPIARYIFNTLVISIFATILVLVVAVPAAYYMARHRFRFRGALLLLVLATQMFAPTAMVIGIYRQFVTLGLVNSFVALILVNAAFNLAFSTWIMLGFFSSIPEEVEEAAMIDGCSRMGVLRRITLPLALPGLLTAIIFTFIASWNEFVVALTLTNSETVRPLTVGITSFVGLYEVQWHYVFAVSLIAILPVVILFILIEKWLVSGLTAGSIK
jgi:multiple sugar transport system permease protein